MGSNPLVAPPLPCCAAAQRRRANTDLSTPSLAAPLGGLVGSPSRRSLALRSTPPSPILGSQSLRVLRRFAPVKSGETEGSPRTEGIVFDEQALHRELERAVKEEDYAQAAKLRDHLRLLQEDSKASVLAANSQFYHAFRNGDLAAMQSLWGKGDNVYVIHPGAGRISGYNLVMGSWEFVCGADYEFPLQIDLKDVEVHVRGDLGYVTCMEVVKTKGNSWGQQVATNVFEKVDGQWFMCIHHASHIDE